MGVLKHYVIIGRMLHCCGNNEYPRWKERLLEACGQSAGEHILNIRKWVISAGSSMNPQYVAQPNCWEFMACHGTKDAPCPARNDRAFNGTHGGNNAGRACWMVKGTRCADSTQETLQEKTALCGQCDFMRSVRNDEPAGDFRIMP